MAIPRLGVIIQGGATASLDGNDVTNASALILSMFKYNGSTTFANSLRAAHPGIKLYGYQAAADIAGSGVENGVSKSQADTHDAGLLGATNDYWIIRNNANWTAGSPSGAYSASLANGSTVSYFGNVGSTSFQNAWATGAIAHAQAAGLDGIFIDNVLGYLNGSVAYNPQTGVAYTDATWATAMLSFLANVVPQLTAAGLKVIGNTYDGSGEVHFDADWINQASAYLDGPMVEYWMQTQANTAAARLEQRASGHVFNQQANLAGIPMSRSKDFHAECDGSTTSVFNYSYAAYLLRWDGVSQGYFWANQSGSAWFTSTPVDPGLPASRIQEVDGAGTVGGWGTHLYRRYYTNGIVLLNADPTTTYTISSYGDGRVYKNAAGTTVATGFTLAPGAAIVLRSDTAYTPTADPAGFFPVANAVGTNLAKTGTYMESALNGPVQTNDLIVVAMSRAFGSNDLAGETVTDNFGNVYTPLPSGGDWDSSDTQSQTLYRAIAKADGIPVIKVTFPNASNFLFFAAAAFRNTGNTPATDVSVTVSGSPQRLSVAGAGTNTLSLTLTTTQASDLVVSAWTNASNGTAMAAGTGHTLVAAIGGTYLEYKTAGGAGSTTTTMSPAGALSAVACAAAFKFSATPVAVRAASYSVRLPKLNVGL